MNISPVKNHNLDATETAAASVTDNPVITRQPVINPSLTPIPPGAMIAMIPSVPHNG